MWYRRSAWVCSCSPLAWHAPQSANDSHSTQDHTSYGSSGSGEAADGRRQPSPATSQYHSSNKVSCARCHAHGVGGLTIAAPGVGSGSLLASDGRDSLHVDCVLILIGVRGKVNPWEPLRSPQRCLRRERWKGSRRRGCMRLRSERWDRRAQMLNPPMLSSSTAQAAPSRASFTSCFGACGSPRSLSPARVRAFSAFLNARQSAKYALLAAWRASEVDPRRSETMRYFAASRATFASAACC